MACGLEGQLHNVPIVVRGGLVEHSKDVLPARADVGCLGAHHLGDASDHHVPDGRGPGERWEGGKIETLCPLITLENYV